MRIDVISISDQGKHIGVVFCEDKNTVKVLALFPDVDKEVSGFRTLFASKSLKYFKTKEFDFPFIYSYTGGDPQIFPLEISEDCTELVEKFGILGCFEQIKQEQFLSLPDPHKQEQEDEANMDLEQKYQKLALILNHHKLKLVIGNSLLIGRVRFERTSDCSPIQDYKQLKALIEKVNIEMPKLPQGIWVSVNGVITHRSRKPNYVYRNIVSEDLLDSILETLDKDLSSVINSTKTSEDTSIPSLPVLAKMTDENCVSPSLKTFLELSETMETVGLTLTPEQENKLLHDAINELQEEIRSLNNQLAKKNQYDLDA